MDNFIVGEIVWAKIRGYPWWPAVVNRNITSDVFQITGIVDENKEKKYICGFIGDNTHSVLPKPKLLDSIRIAKDMLESKGKSDDAKNEKNKKPGEEKSRVKDENKKASKEVTSNITNNNIGKNKRKNSCKDL